jgi:hypothetical protein
LNEHSTNIESDLVVLTKKEKIFSLMIEYGPMVRTEKKHKEKENKKCYTANMDQ